MPAIKVNDTKVTSRSAFIDNLLALESEEKLGNGVRALFRDDPRIFDLVINH